MDPQNQPTSTIFPLKPDQSPTFPRTENNQTGVSWNGGTPIPGLFIRENQIKIDNLGVPPILGNPHFHQQEAVVQQEVLELLPDHRVNRNASLEDFSHH
jgi:hypothetical protein